MKIPKLLCILMALIMTSAFAGERKKPRMEDLKPIIDQKRLQGRSPQSLNNEVEEEQKNLKYQKIREFSDRMMDLRDPLPTEEY